MHLLSSLLQCGAFIVIPIVTFGFGVWKILQVNEKYHRIRIAGLIGFIFFEASVVGLFIDPRSINHNPKEIIFIAGTIGVMTFLFVLLATPIATTILRTFKR